MQFGTREGVQREKMSLQSMARWMINMAYLTKNPGRSSRPAKHDELSFWSHRIIYLGATAHIKLGEREPGWREGLDDKIYIGKETLEVSGQVSLFQICSIYLYISL